MNTIIDSKRKFYLIKLTYDFGLETGIIYIIVVKVNIAKKIVENCV